jgi:hypothetical protein
MQDCATYPSDSYDCDGNAITTIDVYYNSLVDVAGYQFDITGVSISNAFGGAAAAAGFMIETSATTVLIFDISTSIIPAGSGVLVQLEVIGDANAACIENLTLSDTAANQITAEVSDCMTINSGLDCAGIIGGATVFDCAGICGGSTDEDVCGICGGGIDDIADCECAGWNNDACTMGDFSIYLTESGSVLFSSSSAMSSIPPPHIPQTSSSVLPPQIPAQSNTASSAKPPAAPRI